MRKEVNWAITDDGIDASKGAQAPEYFIDKDRLLETTVRGNGTLYDWPVHLSEKAFMSQLVIREFLEVFESACEKYGLELDVEIMANTREYINKY